MKVKEDMICPVLGKHCDDECCTVGSECNLSNVDAFSAGEEPIINITIGGFEIKNLKLLKTSIERGVLEPPIYEGTIKNLNINPAQDIPDVRDVYCTWDKYGKCSNWSREDCFIDVFNLHL